MWVMWQVLTLGLVLLGKTIQTLCRRPQRADPGSDVEISRKARFTHRGEVTRPESSRWDLLTACLIATLQSC